MPHPPEAAKPDLPEDAEVVPEDASLCIVSDVLRDLGIESDDGERPSECNETLASSQKTEVPEIPMSPPATPRAQEEFAIPPVRKGNAVDIAWLLDELDDIFGEPGTAAAVSAGSLDTLPDLLCE